MSAPEALNRLGQSTAEACHGVLEMFAPGKISIGEVTTLEDSGTAFDGVPVPAVAMSVSYVDGVTGGNVFLITLDGAKMLAASMMGMEEPEDPDATELSELELSAVSEAMNQMMAQAAAATSLVLGTEVEIGTPETKTFTGADSIAASYPQTPHAVRVAMSICGEPARLVQLVPNAFVVRMSSALDEIGSDVGAVPETGSAAARGLDRRAAVAGGHPRTRVGRVGPRTHGVRADRRLADGRGRRAGQAGRRRDRSLRQRHAFRHGPPGRRGWNRLGRAHRARARCE